MRISRRYLYVIVFAFTILACSSFHEQVETITPDVDSSSYKNTTFDDLIIDEEVLTSLFEKAKQHDISSYSILSELYSAGNYVRRDSLLADFFLSEIDYNSKTRTETSMIIDSTIFFWNATPTYFSSYANKCLEEEAIESFIEKYKYDVVFQRDRTITPIKFHSSYRVYDEYLRLSISDYFGKTNIVRNSNDTFDYVVYHYQSKSITKYRFLKILGKWYMGEILSERMLEDDLPKRDKIFYLTADYDSGADLFADIGELSKRVIEGGDLNALEDISWFYRDSLLFYSQFMLNVWHKDEAYDYLSQAIQYERLKSDDPEYDELQLVVDYQGAKRKRNLCLVNLYVYYLYGRFDNTEKDKRIASFFESLFKEYPNRIVRYNCPNVDIPIPLRRQY